MLTNTELIDLSGDPGNFSAHVVKEPRYVDPAKCTSCGECTKVCPIELPDEQEKGLVMRKAIYKKYAQAIPGAFAISKRGTAPCKATCPAHVSIQGYIALINQGRYFEALKLFKQNHPFPGICGRVCHHPCEDACTRNAVDEPLGIQYLHRFLADWEQREGKRYIPEIKDKKEESVAVIGSGPAGLSCAYFLAISGFRVVVFEKLPVLGGMLTVGIPSYRLPRDIIESEIRVIKELGVEFKTGVEIGKDVTIDQLRKQGFKAFFMAVGAHECKSMGIEGEDLEGVYGGVDFLRDVNLGKAVCPGERVAVIGGGNVAMDSVRTALRTGAKKPFIIYRRSLEEMPASRMEIEECREEGIEFMTLTNPTRIIGEKGRVKAIECVKMELGEPDESGRRRPVPIDGSEFTMEVDAVIIAIGQESDWSCLTDECKCTLSKRGTINVDPVTLQSQDPDIFAGGDAVLGPASVVEAVGTGHEAAISIERYLMGKDLYEGRGDKPEAVKDVATEDARRIPREEMPCRKPDARMDNFSEVQLGFDEDRARREALRCLSCGICSECYQCVEACMAQAVDHTQKREEIDLNVGSVILCPGNDTYDPSVLDDTYKYMSSPNVITSAEFERILSASGPTMGHLVRLSDKKEPRRIAWLQCVGSRDTNRCGNGYCSSVCCMYAIKEAMIAKEHSAHELDAVIFNMDIRTFGKDYEKYYNRAKDQGIRFEKARVHTIDVLRDSGNLLLRYADDSGLLKSEEFDMVVLSVGLIVPSSTVETARRLGIALNKYNFVETGPFEPINTSRPGVFACGTFQGPKDIPTSVTEASAASAAAGMLLADARGTCLKTVEKPDEIPVEDQEPRIGVFVCDCGINIAGVVDVPAVRAYAETLPHVVYAGENLFTCSQDSQEKIKEIIKEYRINRVVVSSCTPKTHEPIFMDTLESVGLNKYLFEMANIRNQDSWVHAESPEEATEKAKDLVRMSVARAAVLRPLAERRIPVTRRALVVGGGVAGMNAALAIAEQGFEAVIVEKKDRLGGMAIRLTHTIEGMAVKPYVEDLIDRVNKHPLIHVLTQSVIVDFSGYKGNFTTEVLVGEHMTSKKIDHGVVIMATGAHEYKPTEYLYGENERVLTQVEFSRHLDVAGAQGLDDVVMIQCVGSRNSTNPNCSRICCQAAIKNAISLKKANPDARVYILYRDIRTYGLLEDYYTEARRLGVMFFRFDPERPPEAEPVENGVRVRFFDHVLGRQVYVDADMLVLSAGMVPEDTADLAGIMKINRNPEGYFMEAHVKLRPVEMGTEGIYVCGTAHGPKLISESIVQAMAAASRAATLLSAPNLTLSAVTAHVDQSRCAACLVCVRTCPYGVPRINEEGVSEIDDALCQGCGACAAECPAKAIELRWYEDEQLICKVESLLEGVL